MKKLSEYKDEEALDLLANLIEPAIKIVRIDGFKEALENGDKLKAIKLAIAGDKSAVMEMLAVLDGVPRAEYHCNIMTLPGRILEILNDEELMVFFTEQAQT